MSRIQSFIIQVFWVQHSVSQYSLCSVLPCWVHWCNQLFLTREQDIFWGSQDYQKVVSFDHFVQENAHCVLISLKVGGGGASCRQDILQWGTCPPKPLCSYDTGWVVYIDPGAIFGNICVYSCILELKFPQSNHIFCNLKHIIISNDICLKYCLQEITILVFWTLSCQCL